jgi:E3 ubiquitin-protein ligase EDD1
MTSIQFVVHPLPGTQEQLQEKLREVADRLNKYNTSGTPPRIFSSVPDPDSVGSVDPDP